jgi:Domain of unknown function (DUF4365)
MALTRWKVANELHWAFRDKPQIDIGIDGEIEVREPNGAMRGRIISVQVKCGKSFFRAETESGFKYRPKPEHLNYWLSYTTPVVLVLADETRRVCFWQHVHPKNLFSVGGVQLIEVPKSQTLDLEKSWMLKEVARGTQQIDIVRALFKVWLAESSLFTATWNNEYQTPRDFHGFNLFCGDLFGRGITCADVVLGHPRIEPAEIEYLLSMARHNADYASCNHALIGLVSASRDALKRATLPNPPRSSSTRITVEYVPLIYNDQRFLSLEEVDSEGNSFDSSFDFLALDRNCNYDRRRNERVRRENRLWGTL